LKKLNGREVKALFVLSIVVPIGVLATFRLAGILQGPITISETITLEPVIWKRERPYLLWRIPGNHLLEVNHSTHEVALTEVLWVSDYDDNWFGRGPATDFGIYNISVSVQSGFVCSVKVDFDEEYPWSFAYIHHSEINAPNTTIVLANLKVDKMIDRGKNPQLLRDNTKASLSTISIGKPNRVLLANGSVLYGYNSPYNHTHQIQIATEVVYFNGTVYKKIVQPVQFTIGPDNNNSLEDAEEIGFGIHEAYLDGRAEGDLVDYYKIWLEQGQTIKIALSYPEGYDIPLIGIGIEMCVYNPNKQIVSSLLYGKNTTTQVTVNVNPAGWWYLKTNFVVSPYTYIIETFIVTSQNGEQL